MAPALVLVVAPAVILTTYVLFRSKLLEPAPDSVSGNYYKRIMAEANPAAVLAWAKANCDSGLDLAADTPRTHMEIILQVAATYDAASRRRGVAAVCAEAVAATASIATRASATHNIVIAN